MAEQAPWANPEFTTAWTQYSMSSIGEATPEPAGYGAESEPNPWSATSDDTMSEDTALPHDIPHDDPPLPAEDESLRTTSTPQPTVEASPSMAEAEQLSTYSGRRRVREQEDEPYIKRTATLSGPSVQHIDDLRKAVHTTREVAALRERDIRLLQCQMEDQAKELEQMRVTVQRAQTEALMNARRYLDDQLNTMKAEYMKAMGEAQSTFERRLATERTRASEAATVQKARLEQAEEAARAAERVQSQHNEEEVKKRLSFADARVAAAEARAMEAETKAREARYNQESIENQNRIAAAAAQTKYQQGRAKDIEQRHPSPAVAGSSRHRQPQVPETTPAWVRSSAYGTGAAFFQPAGKGKSPIGQFPDTPPSETRFTMPNRDAPSTSVPPSETRFTMPDGASEASATRGAGDKTNAALAPGVLEAFIAVADACGGRIIDGIKQLVERRSVPEDDSPRYGYVSRPRRAQGRRLVQQMDRLQQRETAHANIKYKSIMLAVIREFFWIQTLSEVGVAEEVPPEVLREFATGNYEGPTVDDGAPLQMDWRGDAHAPYNIRVHTILVNVVLQRIEAAGLPKNEPWVAYKMQQRLGHLRTLWRAAQPKDGPDGMESEDQAMERRDGELDDHLRRCRKNTRVQSRYKRRVMVCHKEILIREAQDNEPPDIEVWRHVLRLLTVLGPEGMSSDESEFTGQEKIYRVTVRPERRECTELMTAIDGRHLMRRLLEGRPGRLPVPRVRDDENPRSSERSAPVGWPRSLYNDEWFEGLSTGQRHTLCVSKDAFEWLDVVLENPGLPL